jgi:hypothetical protein
MKISIKSRIHRTIKDFDNYSEISTSNSVLLLDGLELNENETPYGVYENVRGVKDGRIVITNLGLHLFSKNHWSFVNYTEIESVSIDLKGSEKQNSEFLRVKLKIKTELLIPVKGNQGKFRDIFQFSRFLNRVIGDIKSEE